MGKLWEFRKSRALQGDEGSPCFGLCRAILSKTDLSACFLTGVGGGSQGLPFKTHVPGASGLGMVCLLCPSDVPGNSSATLH